MAGGQDHRDSRTWVVLELTHVGEAKLEEGTLPGLLREALSVEPDFPVFIPSVSYVSGHRRTTLHLMEGYAFVSAGLPEVRYIHLEGRCPYVKKVLTSKSPNGMRVLSVIPDASVLEMRNKLSQHVSSDLVEGMEVTVTEGVYANLTGAIVDVCKDSASIRIVLRSIDIITNIPSMFLMPADELEEL